MTTTRVANTFRGSTCRFIFEVHLLQAPVTDYLGLLTNFVNVDWFDLGPGVNFAYSRRGEDITITIYSKQRQQRHNLHNLLISSTPRSSILQQTYSRRNYTPTLTFFYKKNYSPPSTTTIALAFKSLPFFFNIYQIWPLCKHHSLCRCCSSPI